MSALNELIDAYKEYLDGPNDPYLNGWRAGYASALQTVAKALPDHEAEIREQAMLEQMEADCKAACYGCNECWPILNIMWHQRPNGDGIGACESWRIRAAYAKARPEREEKEAEHGA